MSGLALLLFATAAALSPVRGEKPDRSGDLLRARRFMVQLQDLDPAAVEAADPDVLVVDYSWDGGPAREMTRADVARLRAREGRDRIVLAYLSLGEAESYRFYWPEEARGGLADFVTRPNRRWPGNYLVEYWDPRWHDVIYRRDGSYLDRILGQGFDGVFLDTVDTAEALMRAGDELAIGRMADLVKAVAAAARSADPDFLIVAQNPYSLLREDGLVDVLSGVSAEAGLFRGERLAPRWTRERLLGTLEDLREAGKAVAVIEYVRSRAALGKFGRICAKHRFICYAGHRHLDGVGRMVNPGPGSKEVGHGRHQ